MLHNSVSSVNSSNVHKVISEVQYEGMFICIVKLEPALVLTSTARSQRAAFYFGECIFSDSLSYLFLHEVPQWWIILIADVNADTTERVTEQDDLLLGGVCPNHTDVSTQDDKSSECIFNTASVKVNSLLSIQIFYSNAADLKWQHVSIHL